MQELPTPLVAYAFKHLPNKLDEKLSFPVQIKLPEVIHLTLLVLCNLKGLKILNILGNACWSKTKLRIIIHSKDCQILQSSLIITKEHASSMFVADTERI